MVARGPGKPIKKKPLKKSAAATQQTPAQAAAEATRPPASAAPQSTDVTVTANDIYDPNSASAVQAQADAAAADREQKQREWEKAQEDARIKREQDDLIKVITAAFNDYGLGNLYSKIEEYVRKGYNEDAVAIELRNTPEYRERFPAMADLQGRGRAIDEASYIAYERNAAQLERAYGLPSGMLGKESVTKLLRNEVSADELEKRAVLAASAAYQVDQATRDQFQKFYNVGSGGLTAYFLDPDVAAPLLQKQYVAAQIGAEAQKQGIGIGNTFAEELMTQGIDAEQARVGFGNVSSDMTLTEGRGDVATQADLISANLQNNAEAKKKVQRAASSKAAAFQGGTDYMTSKSGDTVGLGSATR